MKAKDKLIGGNDLSGQTDLGGTTCTSRLQAGDQDVLVLFGAQAQGQLREISKSLVDIQLSRSDDLESNICAVLSGIEKIQSLTSGKPKYSIFHLTRRKQTPEVKSYEIMLKCIDTMVLSMQLQEAQLLKEIVVLRMRSEQCKNVNTELENFIKYGQDQLSILKRDYEFHGHTEDANMALWIDRLERKLQDLQISHVVSQQTQTQLEMLIRNHSFMVDQIVATLSGIIPLWRNQISFILGSKTRNDLSGANGQAEKNSRIIMPQFPALTSPAKAKQEASNGYIALSNVNEQMRYSLSDILAAKHEEASLYESLKPEQN